MDVNQLERLQTNGVFGNSQPDPMEMPLHGILSFPCFWKSSKLHDFLRESYDLIKSENSQVVKQFRDKLKGKTHLALPPHVTDWSTLLGEDWKIFQRQEFKAKKQVKDEENDLNERKRHYSGGYKTTYIDHLLKLIRNMMAHPEHFAETEIPELGWNQIKQDKEKFITYWTSRYPKLLIFAWWQFYEEFAGQDKLTDYFPWPLDNYNLQNMKWQNETLIEDVIEKILFALQHNTDQGGLINRYGDGSFTLEFRNFQQKMLEYLLDGNSFVKICINPDYVKFIWISPPGKEELFLKHSVSDNVFAETFDKKLILILTVSILEEESLKLDSCENTRVIFFLNDCDRSAQDFIQTTQTKFSNANNISLKSMPVGWNDIKCKYRVVENGVVRIQKMCKDLSDILPHDVDDIDSVLSLLEGENLNDLLRKNQSEIFRNCKVSNFPPHVKYLERRLLSRREITSKVLRHRKDDIFIVFGLDLEQLLRLTNPDEKITVLDDNKCFGTADAAESPQSRIYLTKNRDLGNGHLNTLKMLASSKGRNIHMIEYMSGDMFKWCESFGSLDIIFISFPKKSFEIVDISEKEFVEAVIDKSGSVSPVFISDKPGMGKSYLLGSLANKVQQWFSNNLVVSVTMNALITQISEGSISKAGLVKALQNMICHQENRFEKVVLENWLLTRSSNKKNMVIELMLDGLDEVDKKHKVLAFKVLKFIRQNFQTMRLWVTVREFMETQVEKEFTTICYKIQPFPETDQVSFILNYWNVSSENKEILEKLATKCIHETNIGTKDISGAPLQCQMIAEIYKNQLPGLVSGKVEISTDLLKLYNDMVETKFKRYLTEKVGLPSQICENEDFIKPQKNEFMVWHMYFALKLLFPDWAIQPSVIDFQVSDRTNSTVTSQGIVENLEPVRFIHRTFAEYFSALFVYKILTKEFPNITSTGLNNVSKLLTNDIFEVEKFNFSVYGGGPVNISKFKNPTLVYFLNEMCKTGEFCPEKSQSVFSSILDFTNKGNDFVTRESVILALMFGNYFYMAKAILENISRESITNFFQKTKTHQKLILEVLVRYSDVAFFEYICSKLEKWSKENDTLLEIHHHIFELALVKGKYEVVKYLVENHKFTPDAWEEIRNSDKQYGVIHHVIRKSRYDTALELVNKRRLLQYLINLDRSVLEITDKDGRTPIQLSSISACFQLKKFLIQDCEANINALGQNSFSILHWESYTAYAKAITPAQYHEMLEFCVQNNFCHFNTKNDPNECTPLVCAVKTYHDSLLESTLKLFKAVGADFNSQDKNGNTILHDCVLKQNCDATFIEKLIDLGVDILVKNKKGETVLEMAGDRENTEIVNILEKKLNKC